MSQKHWIVEHAPIYLLPLRDTDWKPTDQIEYTIKSDALNAAHLEHKAFPYDHIRVRRTDQTSAPTAFYGFDPESMLF